MYAFFTLSVCMHTFVFVYVHILWFDVLTFSKPIQLVPYSRQCLQNAIASVHRNADNNTPRYTMHAYQVTKEISLYVSVFSIAFPCAFSYYYFNNELLFVVKCCMHAYMHVVVRRCSSSSMDGWMNVSVPRVHQIHVLFIVSLSFCLLCAGLFACLHIHCMWRAPVDCVRVCTRILRSLYFDIDYE